MTVLVCAAHPDDEVIGAGGTISKIAKTEQVISVIFSYGDKYPFWELPTEVKKKRLAETKVTEEILGIHKTHFIGLHDMEIANHKRKAVNDLLALIKKYKPNRIFTHTKTDAHIDHRAAHEVTVEAIKKSFMDIQLLSFDINFFNLSKGLRVCYDISDTFGKKMHALNEIKSQHSIIMLLKPMILLKALLWGAQNKCKYAECFITVEL